MTDEEIVMGLKECGDITTGLCKNCPYERIKAPENCIAKLCSATIAYINRLKAERDAIRKETAKEILHDIQKQLWNRGVGKDGKPFDYGDLTSVELDELRKKYNVEVDE